MIAERGRGGEKRGRGRRTLTCLSIGHHSRCAEIKHYLVEAAQWTGVAGTACTSLFNQGGIRETAVDEDAGRQSVVQRGGRWLWLPSWKSFSDDFVYGIVGA